MSGSSARLLIIIDAQDKSQAAFSGVENALKGLDTGSKGAGAALGSMVSQVATAGAVVGGVLATGIGAAVKQAADFEHGLSAVGAASGASASEMQGLHDTALALGASTQLAGINATDAAQAMTQLAKGGVSVADIMGGAANGALLLASAGEIGVGQAADIAVRAMTIFGAKGSDVAHISDLIAAAAGKSATDVGQLGAAFNQSAAVAANAGLSIEELTGTLGFLAQRGLEGSDAGTSLRTALQRLQSPTDTAAKTMADLGINVRDANGKMLPMAQVADILKERLGGLSDAQRDAALQTIFGADAIRVAIPLVQAGGSAITDWTAKVNDAGYAARQGAALNNNLAGSWDQFQATVQTAAIGIGEKFIPVLRKGSDELAKFVDSLASNKDVAKFFDDLAQKAATALDTIIAKVKDPTFQAQMRDWATTAKDLATSILDVAGAVKDTLGPPLKAAADWFGSLDDQGRKNVVMFGLVAGAAIHFRDELGTLKGVVEDVIGAFARKEAAKKSLQAANDGLAGSAGKTATAMSGAGAAALEAADLIATAGIATGGAAIGATALVVGYDKLTNAIGENNDIASQGALRQEAMAIALAHGASMQNGAIDGYLRLVLAQENTVHSTSDLDRIWNQFAGTLQATGQSTDTLGLSLINLNTPIGVMTGGLGLGRNEMQLFAQTGTIVNQSLTGLVSGATAVAAAMVPVSNTVSAADQAFGQVTLSARTMGEGVATAANSMAAVVTTTTTTFGLIGEEAGRAAGGVDGFNSSLASVRDNLNDTASAARNAQTALSEADSVLKGLGGTAGTLQGYLKPLQAQWDALNVATGNGAHVTADQRAQYEALAPFIEYLNGQIGVNRDQTVTATEAAIKNYQAQQQTGNAYFAAAAAAVTAAGANDVAAMAAKAAAAAHDTLTTATGGYTTSTQGAAGATGTTSTGIGILRGAMAIATTVVDAMSGSVNNYTTSVKSVPAASVTAFTTPGLDDATLGVRQLQTAIYDVPPSFTVTATVDISGALASIATLNNNMPHSPAREGPFSTLPNWDALFESFPGAVQGAIGQFQRFGAGVKQALYSLSLGNIAQDIGGGGDGSIGAMIHRFAADFDVALDTMKAVAGAAGDFLTQAHAYHDLILMAVTAIKEAQAALNTVNVGSGGLTIPALHGGGDAAGQALGNGVAQGVRRALDSHSPSQVMAGIGRDVVAGLVQGMTADQQDAAKAAADVASAVAKAVQDTLAAATALGGLRLGSLPGTAQIAGILDFTRTLIDVARQAAAGIATDALAAATAWADGAGKIVALFSSGVDALGKLATFVAPADAASFAFGRALRTALNDLAVLSEQVTQDMADEAATFAEGATKAVALYGSGVDGFTKLVGFVAPAATAIYAFGKSLRAALNDLALLAEQLTTDTSDLAGKFADGAGKAVGILAAGVAGFLALATFVPPADAAIFAFDKSLRALINDLALVAEQVGTDGLDAAGVLADSAGKILGILAGGVTGLLALRDYASPPLAAMAAFVADTRALTQLVVDAAKTFATDGLTAAGQFADAAGKALGILATGVAGFAALADYALPDATAIDAFVLGTLYLVRQVTAAATLLSADGLKAASGFADTAGKALGLLASGVAGFKALPDLIAPTQASIDLFASSAVALVVAIERATAGLATDGLAAASGFADSAGKVLGIVASGVTGLKDLITFTAPAQSAMDAFASAVRDMMATLAAVAGTIATEGATAAATFADAVGKVFAGLNAGTSFFKSLDGILLPDQAGIDRILAPMLAVITTLAGLSKTLDAATIAGAGAIADLIGKAAAGIQAGNQALAGSGGGGFTGGAGGGTVQIIFNAPVYGSADFDQRILQAKIALDRTGAWPS
jgi:TP901 family phage tail tape measure protein